MRALPQLVVKPHDPRRARWIAVLLGVLWLASLAVVWRMAVERAAPGAEGARERLAAAESLVERIGAELEAARQRLAVVERSEQVSRTANEALQATLREREEELAALRADLAFYQRLVGGRAPRQGLTVHALGLRRIGASNGYDFALTLTQNLKKGAITEAEATLAVEGVAGERLTTLDWATLAQDDAAGPVTFAFKYFQQARGSLMLPAGFTPNRVHVVVKSKAGETIERSFAWNEAIESEENNHVRQ